MRKNHINLSNSLALMSPSQLGGVFQIMFVFWKRDSMENMKGIIFEINWYFSLVTEGIEAIDFREYIRD